MEIKIANSKNEYNKCFKFIKKMWLEEFEIDFEPILEEQYKAFLNSNIYYIDEKGKIIAIVQFKETKKGFTFKDGFILEKDCYFLWRIGVIKGFRNKGYGTKLINFGISKIETTNIKTIYLLSEINNIDYYSKFGFEKISDKENKIGNTISFYMEKNL